MVLGEAHVLSRTHREGECEASEGSLMCEDFLRSGFQRFIVDPGVRQAYFPETARKLYTDKVTANKPLHAAGVLAARYPCMCP